MNLEGFVAIFALMSEYFDAKPSDALTEIYFNSFKNWSCEDFRKACQTVMDTRIYNGLPKIDEIVQALYGKEEDRAAIAFQTLIETIKNHGYWDSVIFEDGAISRTVETLGGWQKICEWSADEWKFRRKDFDSLYMANFRRGNTEQIKLVGMYESCNFTKGYTDSIPDPIFIPDRSKVILKIEDRNRLLVEKQT